MKTSIHKNMAWVLAGQLTMSLVNALVFIALSKLASNTDLGRFALGLAIADPAIRLANLNLRAVQATDAQQSVEFRDYLGLRLAALCTALLVIVMIALAGPYAQEAVWIIIGVGLFKTIDAISDIFFGALQRNETMRGIGVSRVMRGTLSFALFASCIAFTESLLLGVVAIVGARLLILLVYDIPHTRNVLSHSEPPPAHPNAPIALRARFRPATMLALAKVAVPLGLTAFTVSLILNVPRYILEHRGGEELLGIFAGMAYFLVLGRIVCMAAGQAATPRMAKLHAQGRRREFLRILAILLMLAGAAGVGCYGLALFYGRPLLVLLFNESFATEHTAFTVIMASSGLYFAASFIANGITATRRFKAQIPGVAVVLLLCLFLCHVLIRQDMVLESARVFLWGGALLLIARISTLWYVLRFSQTPTEAP